VVINSSVDIEVIVIAISSSEGYSHDAVYCIVPCS